ncbi:MAG: DUF167 domain-containing protein [Elusimicrobia bacterium]|nr:DUF167 domain-containing protein [Elusimicrobiota bacterium]
MLLKLKVQPSSSRQRAVLMADGTVKIYLNSPPEKNKANTELVRFISEKLDVPRSSIEIVKGKTSSVKTLHIRGAEPPDIARLTA